MAVSGLPPRMENIVSNVIDNMKIAKDYFELPSWNDFSTAFEVAWRDSVQAWCSVLTFLSLSTRPLWILLSLLSRHIYVVLQVVARHTVNHVYIAMGKGFVQLKIGGHEFVKFQRSLSRFWIMVELGFCALLVTGYLLRRLIIRRKYVGRVQTWYRKKRNMVAKRYYNVVDQVAETSMSLALLLPHLLYIGGCLALKLTLPSLLRYTANGTYTYELISLYYPVFRTARLISVKQSQAKKGYSSTVNTSNADKSKQQTRGSVASRWLGATTADTGSSSKSKLTTKDDSRNSKIMDIDTEASMLLRYWVVYGLIFSMMKAIVLIPFIGPYLSVSGTTAAALNKTPTVTGARFSSFRLLNSKWISYLIPTPYFFYEVRLTFFIWLRLLPTSKTANNLDNESSSSSASRKRKSKYEYLSLSPLDMIYKKLAPIALSLADKSNAVASSATNRLNKHTPDNSKNSVSTIVSIGNKLSSILDLAVLVRVISSKNKDRIVTLVSESYALLPACITLFMPSRFTSYGCIYASAIIPAANSANCETSLGTQGHLRGTNAYKKAKEDRILYLKYWVMNALFLLLLDFVFFTFLQWVPLSTHMTLLVWISLNMPLICKKAYEYLEYELVMFGVLDVEYIENYDMEKTLTVRFFKKLSSSIPVAKKDEDDVQQDTNSRNSKGKKESVATEKSTIAYEVEVDSSDKTSSTDKIDDTPSVNNVVDDENDSVENSTNNTKIDNPTKSITYDVEVNSSDTISPTDKIDDTPLVNNVVDDENDYAENSTDNTKIDNPTK